MKFMSLILIVFLSLPTAYAAMVGEGGITGGGGGSTVPDPVGAELVRKFATERAKFALMAYLNKWNFYHVTNGESHWTKFLLDRPDNAFFYLDKVSIESMNSGPCLDTDGKEVDASVISPLPNGICLSGYRLGQKLNIYNYESEVIALLFHELIHLMGGDEQLAVEFQKIALLDFSRASIEMDFITFDRVRTKLALIHSDLKELETVVFAEASNAVGDATKELGNLYAELTYGSLFALSPPADLELQALIEKLSAAYLYFRSVDPKEKNSLYFRLIYVKGFDGKHEVTLDYYLRDSSKNRKGYEDFNVTQITSPADWQNELDEILFSIEKVRANIWVLLNSRFTVYDVN